MKDRFGIDWTNKQGTYFWKRPFLGRRLFFRHAAAAVGGFFVMPARARATPLAAAQGSPGTARNCIFVLMAGGPAHCDTFDLKEGAWTPAFMRPTTFGDIRWPQGLFPKLAEQMDSISVLRAVQSWVLVHSLGQSWVQIGRNPLAGTSKIAPHIGSVVSRELMPSNGVQTLPAFVSLNAGSGPNQGYLAPEHAPFLVNPGGGGLGNTSHPAGQPAFDRRSALLAEMEAVSASGSFGEAQGEMEQFGKAARGMMYNSTVNSVFTFDAAERARYGNSGFGNACITARNLLKAELGTRFVQISIGGWDNHSNIYDTALKADNPNSVARQFDAALGTLIADLKSTGLLSSTLIVAMGEFGRTAGALNTQNGRDHFSTQAVLMAGGGIRAGQAIGKTDAIGRQIADTGWAEQRPIRAEDIEATIYTALGIDWTKAYWDDPLGRGFYLVPNNQGIEYRPVLEIF